MVISLFDIHLLPVSVASAPNSTHPQVKVISSTGCTCFCTQFNPSTVKAIPWYLRPDAPVPWLCRRSICYMHCWAPLKVLMSIQIKARSRYFEPALFNEQQNAEYSPFHFHWMNLHSESFVWFYIDIYHKNNCCILIYRFMHVYSCRIHIDAINKDERRLL